MYILSLSDICRLENLKLQTVGSGKGDWEPHGRRLDCVCQNYRSPL